MQNDQLAYEDAQTSHEKQTNKPEMAIHKILQRYIPIVGVNFILILILSYFISPWSKVGTVSVEGNDVVYVQNIINESNVRTGDSMIDIYRNQDAIANKVTNEIPQVSETTVEIIGLNDLSIHVEEFSTVAYIAQDGAYLRVLENGVVLEDTYDISIGNQPVLSNFEEGEALNLIIEEMSHLNPAILHLISEIELVESRANPLFIQVFMNNGNRVLSSIPSFAEKISYYPQMVKAVSGQKGVFDMEVGVTFTPFVTQEDIDADTEVDDAERQELEGLNG